jgi:hypothetical protein
MIPPTPVKGAVNAICPTLDYGSTPVNAALPLPTKTHLGLSSKLTYQTSPIIFPVIIMKMSWLPTISWSVFNKFRVISMS